MFWWGWGGSRGGHDHPIGADETVFHADDPARQPAHVLFVGRLIEKKGHWMPLRPLPRHASWRKNR